MKKMFVLSALTILILGAFVLAAGSSTANAEDDNPTPSAVQATAITTCEDKATIRERIKCRIDNPTVARNEAYNATEEACRGHANATKSACENLYKNSAKCYDESNPVTKKRCFLVESGININAGGTFRAAPTESKRNYVVLLLYELQERIESAQEEGKVTADQAASLITKIVEIKRMIIAKEARSSIIVKINEFKKEFREVMGDAE